MGLSVCGLVCPECDLYPNECPLDSSILTARRAAMMALGPPNR
jgi:hypothetical protein